MNPEPIDSSPLGTPDREELEKIVKRLELNHGTVTIFAVAPEVSPNHPVVQQLLSRLQELDELFDQHRFFFSRDRSFSTFLEELAQTDLSSPNNPRRLVMAFGLEQLPPYRLVYEMQQLNLGRERIFSRNLVLIFWLNRARFLDEFANRAPDFWDWRGKVALFETRPSFDPQLHPHQLFYPYLEELRDENLHLKVSGVMQVQRQVDILLDQIYVSLQAEWRQQVIETVEQSAQDVSIGDIQPASKADDFSGLSLNRSVQPSFDRPGKSGSSKIEVISKTVTQKIDLAKVVRDYRYNIILGTPGAGKTTLLRYLALHFAKAMREERSQVFGGEQQEDLGKALMPLLFRIADYAEQLRQQNTLSVLDYLSQFYRQKPTLTATGLSNLLLEEIRQGNCLILMDGLDEVFDRENRKLIVQRIEQFVEEFAANKFVITSRIAGYQDAKLGDRFGEFTITDMEEEQVSDFLHRWCRAIERAQQPDASDEQCQLAGDREAAAILNSIQGNDGVKRLTTNPLLLTILALIHRNGTMLPHRRVELYALAVKTLTETWQMGRNAAYNDRQLAALRLRDVELQLREREVVDLLAPLAYWMHEHKPTGTVTEGEAEQQLIQSLAELRDIAPDSPDMAGIQQDVTKFLRTVRETTGLFVERAPNLYGFMHLTFEEYFAALQIAGNGPDGMLDIIQQRLPEPRWEEPILLALGYYSIYNSQKQVSKLLEQLFSDLTAYQPTLIEEIIKLKNASSTDAMLVWSSAANPTETHEFPLKDLLLAGQVATQVEFKSNLRKQWIEKLIVTVLALKLDSADDTVKQILRSLRQIESFNQQGEVIAQLVRVIEDDALIEEIRARARATLLYVICGQPSASLVGHLTELISQLDPTLFWIIKELVAELGEEITPHLEEACSHVQANDLDNQQIVNFVTAVSYIRSGMNKSGTDHYDTAISRLQHLVGQPENSLKPYLTLSLATCYQEKQDYGKAEEYYRECDAQLAHSISTWRERGECQRLYGKYAMALASFQQMHTLAQTLEKSEEEADALYYMGRTYVDWGKYQEAIAHYEQSRDRYTQIGEELSVADQWHWLGDCYKDWGKYPQAVECQQKELEIRSQLNDQLNVAKADWGLGKIYQAWGKYEAAIAHYQKSGDRYEQLDKQKDAVTQWSWIGNCYKDWGKYERAIECQEQCLAKHQELGDQADVALSYYQLGRIHQDWGKYEEAIAAYEQSRELYQQLGKEADVSNQWGWLADCYKDWGKYEQAIECQQQCLAKRQELGDQADVALSYSQLGTIYKAWDKHEEAITHFQQSRVLYEQLDKKKDVAIQWDWIAYTYQEWGKYEQALEYRQKCFEIRQTLNDQSLIALTHPQFGWIYQDWGKYEEAIAHFQRSRDIYAQLNRDKDVADQWKNLADCYQKWSKYPEAVECQKRCLEIRTTLDSPSLIAVSYYQLGRIYRAWGKYGEAIAAHEQSRELYQQLGKEADVGKLWGWLADCYRDWGRYEQAMEAVQQCLQMRQKLDDPSGIANVHYQFGCIYQAWGKYEEAIAAHEQSRELYQQLGKEADVGNQWDNFADCYRDWGRYEQALEAAQQCLQMRQKLDDPSGIAWVHYQFGCIYQAWGKYEEAIAYHQQSLAIYEQLNLETNIANQWDWIAYCYFQWEKYELAAEFQQRCLNLCQSLDLKLDVADAASWLGRIYKDWHQYDRAMEYHQQSLDLYQEADHREKVARQFRYIAYLQYRQAKDAADSDTAIDLLTQADPNLQRAIQLDNAGDYRENLAYDHTALALLAAEHLRHLPSNAPTIPYLTQFEQAYQTGFTRLTELGQTVDQADEALDIARAYLDVDALRNIDRAEKLARQCLQTFQDYNRRKLEAAARKLLGEIYLARAQHPHSDARVIASTFLNNALQLYRDLDLEEKATEVEHLIQANLL